jgi:hypothetical protein
MKRDVYGAGQERHRSGRARSERTAIFTLAALEEGDQVVQVVGVEIPPAALERRPLRRALTPTDAPRPDVHRVDG